MTKIVYLKKKMTKMLITSIGIMAVLGSAFYGIYYFAGTKTEDYQRMDNDLRQQQSRLSLLEQKFDIYESSFHAYTEIYGELQKDRYALDVNRAQRALEVLRKRHRVSNLTLEISSQQPFSQQQGNYVGFSPVLREVTLRFSALSDAHVYAFTNNIKKIFSGRVQFLKVNLLRKRPFSNEVLLEITKGANPAVVDAEITFLWLGIEEVQEETAGEGAQNANN